MERRGYRGMVTLTSPSGERSVTVKVPERSVQRLFRRNGFDQDIKRLVTICGNAEQNRRQTKRLNRLLSAGWRVVANDSTLIESDEEDQIEESETGEEQKKDTSLVIGTTQTGEASHGGKHASGEVEDSPNAAEKGNRQRRTRGGQKYRRNYNRRRSSERIRLQVQNAGQQGGAGVYSPQPLRVSSATMAAAEESAELLAKLVGTSPLKVRRGVSVNAEQLLVSLETGDNPLPALESPDERPKLKILVTPDCSGSTQNWSGLGCAWALHLSKIPDVDVVYFENFNGDLWQVEGDSETRKLIESVDVVLYLGDGDGNGLCQQYASYGAIVVGMDTYCANSANPRLKTTKFGQGVLHWVDRVSAKIPATWAKSIELCLDK